METPLSKPNTALSVFAQLLDKASVDDLEYPAFLQLQDIDTTGIPKPQWTLVSRRNTSPGRKTKCQAAIPSRLVPQVPGLILLLVTTAGWLAVGQHIAGWRQTNRKQETTTPEDTRHRKKILAAVMITLVAIAAVIRSGFEKALPSAISKATM